MRVNIKIIEDAIDQPNGYAFSFKCRDELNIIIVVNMLLPEREKMLTIFNLLAQTLLGLNMYDAIKLEKSVKKLVYK